MQYDWELLKELQDYDIMHACVDTVILDVLYYILLLSEFCTAIHTSRKIQ
jgi:hypothetical protein